MKDKIIALFTKEHNLRFSEIEKALNQRSNKVSYHLNKLLEKGIIEKEDDKYSLGESSEYLVPYISDKNAVIPVVLIHIGDNKKSFFHTRNKRPYKNRLGLPGGRLMQGECIFAAAKRIAHEKCNMAITPKYISNISLEHVKKSGKIIHSFLLIMVHATISSQIKMTYIGRRRKEFIPSDFKLAKEFRHNNKINVKTIYSREN